MDDLFLGLSSRDHRHGSLNSSRTDTIRRFAAVKARPGHKNATTRMKYDPVPVEDRRDALDRMG